MKKELADAVRAVNARMAEVDDPDTQELRCLWAHMQTDLDIARAMGNDIDERRAIGIYRRKALKVLNGE